MIAVYINCISGLVHVNGEHGILRARPRSIWIGKLSKIPDMIKDALDALGLEFNVLPEKAERDELMANRTFACLGAFSCKYITRRAQLPRHMFET